MGLISNNSETQYRLVDNRLTCWCMDSNTTLNNKKTKEIIIDFRRQREAHTPLTIMGEEVGRVTHFKSRGTYINEDLTCTVNTSNLVKKAQQQFCFLRTLRKNNLSAVLLRTFYQCFIESVLAYCLTAWYANCIEADQKSLQRAIQRSEKIVGLSLENIFCTCCLHRAKSMADVTHPSAIQ